MSGPFILDPWQTIVGVHFPEEGDFDNPSHIAVRYQLSIVPWVYDGIFDWITLGGGGANTVWQGRLVDLWAYYPQNQSWTELITLVMYGIEFGTPAVSGFVDRRHHIGGGAGVGTYNQHGAGPGVDFDHSAIIPGYGGAYGVGPLFTIGGESAPGPSPSRHRGLRTGRLQGFYSRGPGGAVIDTWDLTADVTISVPGIGFTPIGHVVIPHNTSYIFDVYDDTGAFLDTGYWPDGNYWGSVAYEVYAING